MAKTIKINLFGATGHRTVEVKPKGGFPTRHIKAPRGTVPSIFDPVTDAEIEAQKRVVAERKAKAANQPEEPKIDLQALLAKVDAIMANAPDPAPDPTPDPDPTPELSEGQDAIVKVLRKTRSYTLDDIAEKTGINALYIMHECRILAEMGIVTIESTLTARRYRLAMSKEKSNA